jgi:hypothetical protein
MQLGATTPDHVFNNADFGEVRVDNFLVFRVVFHCFLFSPFAFVHWIVGPSLIYGKESCCKEKIEENTGVIRSHKSN